jgi:heptosyltransferase-2
VNERNSLLVVELWGLGDLVIATPFLQAASRQYAVTLLAKPYALDLQPRFWPEVRVVPFVAPWTAFRHKYKLYAWPWGEMARLRRLRSPRFDIGLSARWDPRDHFLMWTLGARRRLGFPRLRSRIFLTDPVERPAAESHRRAHWAVMAEKLGLTLENVRLKSAAAGTGGVLIHSGAGQPVRVWPLERYHLLSRRLRQAGHAVRVACDPDQRDWWLQHGEQDVQTPTTVGELMRLIDQASAFVGNDSGPSHLAAICGVPTFTLFGPQLPEWFAPIHPESVVFEGKACPYKPCSDYCRFPQPFCIQGIGEDEVWPRVQSFAARHSPATRPV